MEKEFYRRHLPHFQISDQIYFLTWIIAPAVPTKIRSRIEDPDNKEKDETPWSAQLDEMELSIHEQFKDGFSLVENDLADVVCKTLHFWDQTRIDLIGYCVMPNHVHAVFRVFERDEKGKPLYLVRVMQSIKRHSALECNRKLKRSGKFWQHESYDRLIRDREEFYFTLNYVLDNPVKAGLCGKRSDWKWSYIKSKYSDLLD